MKAVIQTVLVLFVLFVARPGHAGEATNLFAHLEPVPLFPDLRTAAKPVGIPLDGIVPATHDEALSPGDSITALVTLHQKGNRRTQWLVYFKIIATSNETRLAKSAVLYNSMGDRFEFPRSPATFQISTLGPYVNSTSFWGKPTPKEKSASVTVNGGFLGLGLDRAAAAVHRMNVATNKTQRAEFNFSVAKKPSPRAVAAKNQKLAAELRITPDEERALAGFDLATTSYFTAVSETPNLESMLWKVVSLPSIWSMVKHGGVTASMGFDIDDIDPVSLPSNWGLPGRSAVYTLPLLITLNQYDALNVTFLVTDPRPPLLACGGIVGFLAQNPHDNENYLTFRVISARCGSDPSKQTTNEKR